MNKHIINVKDENILIEEISPYGNLVAYVECNDEVCYFYIVPLENKNVQFKPIALWLRNLVDATENWIQQKEKPPIMPAKYTQHKKGLNKYQPQHLKILWFSDGCGAILHYQNQIEAIIPPWASMNKIAGYTKEAIGFETPFLPLPEKHSNFYLRIKDMEKYWKDLLDENSSLYWNHFKQKLYNQYNNIFLEPVNHYMVPNDFLPKVEILEYKLKDYFIYITLGMSRHPIPKVEFFYKTHEEIQFHSYVEMILILKHPITQELLNVMGMFSTYPWRNLVFLDVYHSFEYMLDKQYDGFFTAPLEKFKNYFSNEIIDHLSKKLQIKFLALIPATQEDFLVSRGKGIEFAVRKKLTNF